MSGWEIKLGYAPTLGALKIEPTCPHGAGKGEAYWLIPISKLLREVKMQPEQLRAHLQEAEHPAPEYDGSTEDLCDEAIRSLDLTGKNVLDVGGYGGRAARVAIEQGARRAVCLDSRQWEHYGWAEPEKLPGVEYRTGDFMGWHEPVDVVLCFNVIYHCPDPYGALNHLRAITREMLLCSLVVWDDRPVWYPKEPFEVNPTDDTVYWAPSDAGLRKLLAVTGWRDVQDYGKTVERLVVTCR